jgi:EAL domain-containing protein (putative c-di-GMP-specific phosphodiesterase class I)
VAARSIDLGGPGLNRSDAAKAVLYALRQFADTGVSDALPTSLNEGLAQAIDTAVARVSGLRRMIDHGTFELHFQPIVDLVSRAVHHQEALTRLPDGRSPFQTVSLAEEIGVINELDYLVAERSLQLLEATPTAVDIAVNISGRSIESAAFIAMFEALLERYRHVRSRLLLELTESAKINDLARAAAVVQHLRKSGQKVYIDDFGSGAAAFHYLRALQVDAVKIDGLFIREISRNNRDRMFVKAIRSLCAEMGLATVAEQIENPQDATLLTSIGVTYGQGYHFGKPSRWVATRTPGARGKR